MVCSPPKSVGLAVGSALITLIVLVDVFAARLARVAPPSLLTFVLLCVLVASVPAVLWLAYRCYGLARARYVLSRNALVVEWGERRELIPMGMITAARPAADVEGALRPRGVNLPGCVLGRALVPALGEVEFIASTGKAGLVLVGYPGGWLAISPPDPQAFLAAFAERRAEGVEQRVQPESVRPAYQAWGLWHDRLALGLVGLGGLSVLLLVAYLTAIFPQLPGQIALRFNAQGEPDRFGAPAGLFILPAIAGVAWALNTLGGVWLHRRENERAAAYLLFGATAFVQALVWVAAIGLLTAGRPN